MSFQHIPDFFGCHQVVPVNLKLVHFTKNKPLDIGFAVSSADVFCVCVAIVSQAFSRSFLTNI